MADQNLELRRAFDGLVAEYVPGVEQVDAARLRFQAVVQVEQHASRRSGRTWSLRIAAVAALVVAIAVVSNVLPVARPTANAFLVEIAEATRVLPDDTSFPAGGYLYTDTTNTVVTPSSEIPGQQGEVAFVYVLPVRTQSWQQGEFLLNRITVGTPIFFDPSTEENYYQSGFDELDRVGETYDVPQDGFVDPENTSLWSTDPAELRDQLEAAAESSHASSSLDRRIIDVAEDLLRPAVLAPPQLRAALIEVIAGLNVDVDRIPDGNVLASVEYDDEFYGTVAYTLTFNPDGYLVKSTEVTLSGSVDGSIPPNTTYVEVELAPPLFVDQPGEIPGG